MELGDEQGASGLKKRHEAMIILIGSVAGVAGLILALEARNSSAGGSATAAAPSATAGTPGTSAVATDYSSQIQALQQEITGIGGGLSQDQTALQAVQANQGALGQGVTQLGAAFNSIAQQIASDEGNASSAYSTLVAQIAQNKQDAATAAAGVSAQDQQGLTALEAAFNQAINGVEGDVSKLGATDQANISALAQQQAASLASLTDKINSQLSTQQQQIAANAAGFTSIDDWIKAIHTVSIQNSNVLSFDTSGGSWNHGFSTTPSGAPTVTGS